MRRLLLAATPLLLWWPSPATSATGQEARFLKQDPNLDCDVAVIGGGAAGANAAVFLKDEGYKVCVFEKEARLGGHCQTQTIPAPAPGFPNWVDLGVQVIINSTWQNENGFGNWRLDNGAHLTRFMGRSNVFDISFSLTDGLQSYIYADFIQGQGPQSKVLTEDDKAAIQNATDAYFRILEERYPWLEDAATFPEVIPEELLVPFSDFLLANPVLAPLVNTYFYVQTFAGGMGSYDRTLTLYQLLSMRRGNYAAYTTDFGNGAMVVNGGCGAFYAKIAEYLGDDSVYLGAVVKSIKRPQNAGRAITITVDLPTPPTRTRFKVGRVIMAAPQTASNMALFDMDKREEDAFADILVRPYYIQLYNVSGSLAPTPFNLANINFSVPYNPPASGVLDQPFNQDPPTVALVSRRLPYGPATALSWADDPLSMTAMQQAILDQLAGVPGSIATFSDPAPLNLHIYNPYFTAEALRRSPNPYTKLNGLQGYRSTYYLGALLNYAESAKCWEHAYRVVKDFF